MEWILLGFAVLMVATSTYLAILDKIKRQWIIGFDGSVIRIRGPFDMDEYLKQLDLARNDFKEYVIWRRSFSNQDKIMHELMQMYHMSRIVRRISSTEIKWK